jgi:hypothetical protein
MREVDVREFRMEDGAAVRAFWEASGIRIRPGDDDHSLAAFADRNPALFLLALDEQGLAATALGGWDGRRGWLYHVAVAAGPPQARDSVRAWCARSRSVCASAAVRK